MIKADELAKKLRKQRCLKRLENKRNKRHLRF